MLFVVSCLLLVAWRILRIVSFDVWSLLVLVCVFCVLCGVRCLTVVVRLSLFVS